MDNKKLQELLQQLHDEIQKSENIDSKGKDLLQDIDSDVHELLKRSEGDISQVHQTVIQRFENTIDHLEATHPNITGYLTELLEILSNAGI